MIRSESWQTAPSFEYKSKIGAIGLGSVTVDGLDALDALDAVESRPGHLPLG